MKVGIAGTGRMGTAVAVRLVSMGHEVAVWNRTPDNTLVARKAGARWIATLDELATASDVVISFLADNAAVGGVYLGPGGLVAGRIEGRLFIDMSTVSPGAHQSIAPAMEARGADFIECPVSGSVPTVLAGVLVGFVGGPAAAFARAQPLLQQLCRRVEHVGPLGAGARMKLAANLLLAIFWQALGESLFLTDAEAVDAARAVELLGDSNIGASILRTRATQIVAALNGTPSGAVTFDVDTLRKDLRYMAEEARAHGRVLPLVSRTLECFDRAAREGKGHLDSAAYPAYWLALPTTDVTAPRSTETVSST